MRLLLLFTLVVSLGAAPASQPAFTYDHGGIVRGDFSQKKLSIVFTAGDYGEGVPTILKVCEEKKIRTAFFVTGNFLRSHAENGKAILNAGHILGPHSDGHLLYCSWDKREQSLVTEQQFKADLLKNLQDLVALGARDHLFLPPYEWFNESHVKWAADLGLTLINFSPGSKSNRDYIPESDPKFVSSEQILKDILSYEETAPNHLNGYILLLHAGSQRKDKMHERFGELVETLQLRGYEIVRVDELLSERGTGASPVHSPLERQEPQAHGRGAHATDAVIRANQIGYLPNDPKIAILSSESESSGDFAVGDFRGNIGEDQGAWGPFKHNYRLDFSKLIKPGTYHIEFNGERSLPFEIGDNIYDNVAEKCLDFMHLQRCGNNPVTSQKCHQQDAIDEVTGKQLDLTGGWHDAADRIKHNITTSFCVAALALAGQIDEAKYGAQYLKKIHPDADTLYVQVADDRDHSPPVKLWHEDESDYGHGKAGPRSAWPATGKPEGPRYQNKSSGVASLAGRCSAAMSLLDDLDEAKSLYELGKRKPGNAMSVPVKAPYYYGESTWHDDMEWAAAELYRKTQDKQYLDDAVKFALQAADNPWMGSDRHGHYEFFPYVNLGHWRVYEFADADTKSKLAAFYRSGLEKIRDRAMKNPYRLGTPLVWCSTNDVIAFATQAKLYEQMTGDTQFRELATEARDWIFGRNPWGVSFVLGVPETGNPARKPHHLMYKLANILPVGGLVDGPVYKDINDSLKFGDFGEDRYAAFQSGDGGVYHDVYGDFSTNEPIIDGTVSLMLMMKVWK